MCVVYSQGGVRFCINDGSKISKINDKVCQLDWKSNRKLIQNSKQKNC